MEKTSDILRVPVIICGNSPFIKVKFENQELTFLIDSGAYGCMVDRKYIHLSDSELGKKETLTGFNGVDATGHAIMMFFTIEDEKLCCPFTTLDLGLTFKNFNETIGEVAGLIGGEFLYNYEAIIDYATPEIRICKDRIHLIVEETKKMLMERGAK